MKKLYFVCILVALALAVAGSPWAADKGPIKVGWLSPHTGQGQKSAKT